MLPFEINFNQILTLLNPSIVLKSQFCIIFNYQKQHFAIYRARTSSPLMCMHIPSGNHYPAYQVFYFLSETLSFEHFMKKNNLDDLPDVEEIASITETASKDEILKFSLGLLAPSMKNINELSQESQHLLNIAQSAAETVDFPMPVYINRDYSLSFLLSQTHFDISGSFQVCDFSAKDSRARYSHLGGSWVAPAFAHQTKFLVTFSPVSFLQYFSEKGLTDELSVVFSPEFAQIDIYNHFFPMVNEKELPLIVLLHSNDITESINDIRFLLYCFNYFTNITTSFNQTSNYLEITFVFDKEERLALTFSKFFNSIRTRIRESLSILPDTEIDEDFFRLFLPTVSSDYSRYPDPYIAPENPKDDACLSIPINKETTLALLTELPKLFNLLFVDPNQSFEIELYNPFPQ